MNTGEKSHSGACACSTGMRERVISAQLCTKTNHFSGLLNGVFLNIRTVSPCETLLRGSRKGLLTHSVEKSKIFWKNFSI